MTEVKMLQSIAAAEREAEEALLALRTAEMRLRARTARATCGHLLPPLAATSPSGSHAGWPRFKEALKRCFVSSGCCRPARPPRPTHEEASDLGILWHLLQLHLHEDWTKPPPPPEDSQMHLLSWAEFQLAFGLGWNAAIIKRIFDMLDTDSNGLISLEDFTVGLFPLASALATLDDKLLFLFRCLDLDDSGAISRQDLYVHLHLCASQGDGAHACSLSPAQLEAVVDSTFAEADLSPDGRIRFAGFVRMMSGDPARVECMVGQLGLNVNRAIADAILGLDDRWLAVGGRTPSMSTVSSSCRSSIHDGESARSHRRSCSLPPKWRVSSARLSATGSLADQAAILPPIASPGTERSGACGESGFVAGPSTPEPGRRHRADTSDLVDTPPGTPPLYTPAVPHADRWPARTESPPRPRCLCLDRCFQICAHVPRLSEATVASNAQRRTYVPHRYRWTLAPDTPVSSPRHVTGRAEVARAASSLRTPHAACHRAQLASRVLAPRQRQQRRCR